MLVHHRPVIHWDDGFGRWRAIAQSIVGAFCVVMSPPLFDQNLSFAQAVEDLTDEQFVPESAVEAFTVSVLPRAPRFDVGRLGANGGDPVPDSLGDKFRPIVFTIRSGNLLDNKRFSLQPRRPLLLSSLRTWNS